MAERGELDFRHLAQVVVKPRHRDNIQCLSWFQAFCDLPLRFLRFRHEPEVFKKRYHWYHQIALVRPRHLKPILFETVGTPLRPAQSALV